MAMGLLPPIWRLFAVDCRKSSLYVHISNGIETWRGAGEPTHHAFRRFRCNGDNCPSDNAQQLDHIAQDRRSDHGRTVVGTRPDKWGDECRTSPGRGAVPVGYGTRHHAREDIACGAQGLRACSGKPVKHVRSCQSGTQCFRRSIRSRCWATMIRP